MKAYESLEIALQKTLADVKSYGFITSPRGRESKELIGHGYVLTNPLNRLVGMKERDLNPYYMIGNLLWVLRQSNKLEVINYYNPRGRMFSDDGQILRGAYGKRIFDFDGINQWNNVIKELKADPDSRRAVINFFLPQHDWTGSLDTPCTTDIQFFIRDNKLHLVNHMRSQSSAFVQPYDVFLMTMLQELLANELGVEIGIYKHFCGSYHYFTDEESMVDNIINSEDYTSPMTAMPKGTTYNSIKPLLYFESDLREKAIELNKIGKQINQYTWTSKLYELRLDNYWNQLGFILILKAMEFTGIKREENQFKYVVDNFLQEPFTKFFQ